MIKINKKSFVVTCNVCNEEVFNEFENEADFNNFKQVIGLENMIKELGWATAKHKGEIQHFCPYCQY